jgi:hypothetical protein
LLPQLAGAKRAVGLPPRRAHARASTSWHFGCSARRSFGISIRMFRRALRAPGEDARLLRGARYRRVERCLWRAAKREVWAVTSVATIAAKIRNATLRRCCETPLLAMPERTRIPLSTSQPPCPVASGSRLTRKIRAMPGLESPEHLLCAAESSRPPACSAGTSRIFR